MDARFAMTKKKYLGVVKDIRKMLAGKESAVCPCPKHKCEWHGRCYECVRIHRHFGDHVPNCLQPMLQEKVQALTGVAEMTATPKPKTPDAYWDYVNRVAPRKKAERSTSLR